MAQLKKLDAKSLGRNGFESEARQYIREDMPEKEAVVSQDLARFVMREMGSFFPSIEEMKRVAEADGVNSVKERMKMIKSDREDCMVKLSMYYAQTIDDEALDRYYQTSEIRYHDSLTEEHKNLNKNLETFFKQNRALLKTEFAGARQHMTYAYLQEFITLAQQRCELEMDVRQGSGSGAASGTRTGAPRLPFPSSASALLATTDREVRLAVAKYLMADDAKRENMRSKMNWVKSETEPLIAQFNSNDDFRQKVEELVRSYESRDPRTRVR